MLLRSRPCGAHLRCRALAANHPSVHFWSRIVRSADAKSTRQRIGMVGWSKSPSEDRPHLRKGHFRDFTQATIRLIVPGTFSTISMSGPLHRLRLTWSHTAQRSPSLEDRACQKKRKMGAALRRPKHNTAVCSAYPVVHFQDGNLTHLKLKWHCPTIR